MIDNKTVKGTRKLNTANSPVNAITALITQIIRDTVNTADLVTVDKADQNGTNAAGYASATPLVCQIDGYNNTLPPASLPKLPFFRPQAGKAAIIMDPQPGDKAVAVFLKRDSSGAKVGENDRIPPASFRTFDQADGYLINGFLGEAPEIWLNLNPVTGNISLSTKAANIEISCRESGDIDIRTGQGNVSITASSSVEISAGDSISLNAPDIILNGNVQGTSSGNANFTAGTFSINADNVSINEEC